MLALFLHECAHVIAAAAMHMEITRMTVLPFGCEADIDGFGNAYKEAICAAAGPVFNIAVAALMNVFSYFSLSEDFMAANIAIAAVNFLPALPLDGGRIIYAGLKNILNEKKAKRILYIFGVIIGFLMIALFLYLIYMGDINITLAVMGMFMVMHAFCGIKNAGFNAFVASNTKKERLYAKRCVDVRYIALNKKANVYDAIKEFESKKMNMVCVMDDDLKVLGIIGEKTLLDIAASAGLFVKLGQLTLTGKSGKISCGIKEF